MPTNSVVVTGIGLVTPLGLSAEENLKRCWADESGIGPVRGFEPGPDSCRSAAYVSEFELGSWLRFPKNAKFMNRGVRFAMQAAREAIERSGLVWEALDPLRIALHTGSGQTGLEYEEYFQALEAAWDGDREMDFRHLGGLPSRLIDRYIVLRYLANGGLGLLSTEFGIQGSNTNMAQTDASSAHALGRAYYDLMENRCDVALTGGYDSLLGPSNFLAYQQEGLLSRYSPEEAYRPFDRSRDGLVLGEGAGFLVFERRQDAERRGAEMFAEIRGVAGATDSGYIPRDVSFQLENEAGFDFVIARGIGARTADTEEAFNIEAEVGSSVPVSAFKSRTGYLGAATAAVELGLGLLCARERCLPPVARLRETDEGCGLNLVRGHPWALKKANPLGLFLSGSWTGQTTAITARAFSH
jgi:3-oxoacyl-(acyl-carrier-protein) synthase